MRIGGGPGAEARVVVGRRAGSSGGAPRLSKHQQAECHSPALHPQLYMHSYTSSPVSRQNGKGMCGSK